MTVVTFVNPASLAMVRRVFNMFRFGGNADGLNGGCLLKGFEGVVDDGESSDFKHLLALAPVQTHSFPNAACGNDCSGVHGVNG